MSKGDVMIIRLRKSLFYFTLGAIILSIIVCFVSFNIASAVSSNAEDTKYNNTIVIDPGHGGIDPGTISKNGVYEKDINLAIALCLKDILKANGFNVIMTRETDVSIHDSQYTKISKIKSSDLKNRLKLIEKNKDGIAILIHQNHFSEEKYSGAQMFYGQKNENSKILASCLQQSIQTFVQPQNDRQIKPSTKDVYILHNATTPTVLAECGFLSNEDDTKNLCDEEYQQKIAFSIFCGIVEYQKMIKE